MGTEEIIKEQDIQDIEEQKSSLVIKVIVIIVAFFVVVLGIWYFSSGLRERSAARNENAPITAEKKSTGPEISFYNRWVKISSPSGVAEIYPEKEYIEINAVQPNMSGTDSTYWTLQNSRGEAAPLGLVSTLPLLGKVNATGPLNIKAKDHLIVSTGRSPIGVSFQLNICMPYLEQFQDFLPPLSGDCPGVYDIENDTEAYESLDKSCRTFIRGIPQCTANTRPFPADMTASCKTFIESKMNYNNCVASYKNDRNFYLPEWRIFLGKDKEFWGNTGDTITLFDNKGKLVDVLKY